MLLIAATGPAYSQEPRIPFVFPTWVAEIPPLGPSGIALVGSWNQEQEPELGLEPRHRYGMWASQLVA